MTTFRVWKNDIGKGGIKDFLKGARIKEGGLFEKGGGINSLCKLWILVEYWLMLFYLKDKT